MVFQEVRFLLNFLGEGNSNTKSILTTGSTIQRDSWFIGYIHVEAGYLLEYFNVDAAMEQKFEMHG